MWILKYCCFFSLCQSCDPCLRHRPSCGPLGLSSGFSCVLSTAPAVTQLVSSPPCRASDWDHDWGRACDCDARRADHGACSGKAGCHPQRHQLSAKVSPSMALGLASRATVCGGYSISEGKPDEREWFTSYGKCMCMGSSRNVLELRELIVQLLWKQMKKPFYCSKIHIVYDLSS